MAFLIDHKRTELYSPAGQCNYNLAPFPGYRYNHVLVYGNNRIIACCAKSSCWEYNIHSNSWLKFTQTSFEDGATPGIVYNNKLYIMDQKNSQVLDLVSNIWSKWHEPFGFNPSYFSLITWKDCLIYLAGFEAQTFNVTTQTWDSQFSKNAPIKMFWSSALLSDEDEVLVVGSLHEPYHHSTAKYYPKTKSWVKLQDSKVNHYGSRLTKLGKRIFAIGSTNNHALIEEFIGVSNTWSSIGVEPIHRYHGSHSVVALPASLFAHLPQGCKGVL